MYCTMYSRFFLASRSFKSLQQRTNNFRIEIISLPISVDQNRIGIRTKIDDDLKVSKVIRINDLKHWLIHHFVVKIKLQPSTSKLTWGDNEHRHCIGIFVLLASFTVQWPIMNQIRIDLVDFLQLIIGSYRQKVNRPFSKKVYFASIEYAQFGYNCKIKYTHIFGIARHHTETNCLINQNQSAHLCKAHRLLLILINIL